MSTPRYDWWPYVKGMIRRYPELCVRANELHNTSITPSYSGIPGGGYRGDKTADAALRELPEINRRELEAVREAIRVTKALPHGKDRMEILQLVYWKRTHTLFGAAHRAGFSERTVTQWNGDFIREVAKKFGLL